MDDITITFTPREMELLEAALFNFHKSTKQAFREAQHDHDCTDGFRSERWIHNEAVEDLYVKVKRSE